MNLYGLHWDPRDRRAETLRALGKRLWDLASAPGSQAAMKRRAPVEPAEIDERRRLGNYWRNQRQRAARDTTELIAQLGRRRARAAERAKQLSRRRSQLAAAPAPIFALVATLNRNAAGYLDYQPLDEVGT